MGSQRAALKKRSLRFTYQVARRHNPQGLILANLSAHTCVRQAREAVEMLDAQILQLHLNPAQEFIMPEGDEIPPGLVDNIAAICAALPVPVLVKEVGFGMSSAQARTLFQAGVKAVDVSGVGGTNFALIEGRRNQSSWWKPFASWGLPTPLCVADVSRHVPELQVIASGGVDDGLKALKCLALGASNVAVAGGLLSALHKARRREAPSHPAPADPGRRGSLGGIENQSNPISSPPDRRRFRPAPPGAGDRSHKFCPTRLLASLFLSWNTGPRLGKC